ncbi:MAG TPA: DUF4920 domain-containing protein [Pyrinomonadaceae bacterium]|nr:DUF4920 domain-containing protein [Pyrinomonadaceae bacterium]
MTKRLLIPAALVAALATAAAAQSHPAGHGDKHDAKHGAGHAQEHGHKQGQPSEQAAPVTLAEGQTITRGAAVSADAAAVKLADVLKEPAKFADRSVVVEGVVERVCQKQGCWLELAPEKGARGVRVAMKEHAFFVPFNSAGLRARAQGIFEVKTLTKEDADHFEKEGARLTRNADGTATEVSFTASGVELRK